MLNPKQLDLFSQLQPGEKDHALVMVDKLIEQGENQPDLLVAAMLHDIGKLHYRLNPLERMIIVLVGALKPNLVKEWGNLSLHGWDSLPGWRKPFVVSEQHAGWGAALARQSGVSPLTENLVREHHHPQVDSLDDLENSLLYKLWAVDNES